jgi:hypothetical protein
MGLSFPIHKPAYSMHTTLKRIVWVFASLLLQCLPGPVWAQRKTENVFLIMTDGLRWQEVFGGADSVLISDATFTPDPKETQSQFWAGTASERREKLMPFFWQTIARQGQLYGNRAHGSQVNVSNPHWFSYPGYSETLTGFVDSRINSNDKVLNPNTTVLEFLNQQPGFGGKLAAFATWDAFDYILNETRSGIPVNSGYQPATGNLSAREELINELQTQVPSPWGTTRLDWMTYHLAKEYVKREHPRVLFLSFDETDDYAHAGKYDTYLKQTRMVDGFIGQLWDLVQSMPEYKDKTTFVITTDHGRGQQPAALWKDHGAKVAGADQIWLAVIGPDTPPVGEVKTRGQYYQSQVAATVAALLGLNYTNVQPVAEPIREIGGVSPADRSPATKKPARAKTTGRK